MPRVGIPGIALKWLVLLLTIQTMLVFAKGESIAEALTAEGFTSVPVERYLDECRLCVPVKINGHELKLLIDTGAPFTLISRQAADRCDLEMEKETTPTRGVNGIADENAGLAKINSFTIAGVELNPAPVVVSKFHFQYLFGNGFDGLLGLATMKINNVLVGYAPHLFCFSPFKIASYRFGQRLRAGGYNAIDLSLNVNRYFVPLTINGKTVNSVIDTGTQYTVVSLDFAQRQRLTVIPSRLFSSGMDGNYIDGKVVRPAQISIASHPVPPVAIAASPLAVFLEHKSIPGAEANALLGLDLMSRFSPVIDTGNNRLYLYH